MGQEFTEEDQLTQLILDKVVVVVALCLPVKSPITADVLMNIQTGVVVTRLRASEDDDDDAVCGATVTSNGLLYAMGPLSSPE